MDWGASFDYHGVVEALSEKSIELLNFLLPGFLAAWVFYGLTAHPKKEAFERIVQALIFTFIVKAEVIGLHKLWWVEWHPGHSWEWWTPEKELVWSLICALSTGLFFAACANWDLIHRFLRLIRLTKRTAYPSEWYSGLHRFKRQMILHLKGERRLRGWAEEWPDQPDSGYFIMAKPLWVSDQGVDYPQEQIERLMVAASDVEMVELLFPTVEVAKIETIKKQVESLGKLNDPAEKPDESHAVPQEPVKPDVNEHNKE